MLEFVSIPLGSGGVCACERCAAARSSVPASPPAGPAPAAQVAQALGALTAAQLSRAAGRAGELAPIDGVLLDGFEPFRHPELVSIIDRVRATGVARIGVQTSGAALSQAGNAAGSIGAGVRVFEFVLLGEAARHDVLCGTPGAFDAAMAGIVQVREAARAAGVRVFSVALVRLCPHNRGQLVAAVAAAVAAGVRAVRIQVEGDAAPDQREVRAAHEVATTAGVALFGDGAEHLLNGASLYRLVGVEALAAPAAPAAPAASAATAAAATPTAPAAPAEPTDGDSRG